MTRIQKTVFILVAIIALVLGLTVNKVFNSSNQGDPAALLDAGIVLLPQSRSLPALSLTNQDGQAVAVDQLKGKWSLLFFGYTFCPDICPTSLGFTSQALASLDKAELDKVQMLFVTVDPERDTLDKLKAYTAYFHPSILGLSGTPEEIARVAKSYGAVYAKQETGSAGGYVVDHSANTYVIAPDGSLFKALDHGTPPPQVVEAIRAAMNKS